MGKLNRFLCGLAVTATLISCSRPSSPNYEGQIDSAACDVIAGWVWDANEPNRKVLVTIFDGDAMIASVRADAFRPDLQAAHKGDGNHAFALPPPASLKDGRSHSIRARIEEGATKWELIRSPQALQCPAP